jgi:hypothetical protein
LRRSAIASCGLHSRASSETPPAAAPQDEEGVDGIKKTSSS